ncbi:sequestosome-1 [Coccinella septempunctata]|uniref:sequestosome-1 n=1 Tax=Coccinella septempunctata TaxID=41139 RepID=UPI001D08888D|nr:sequestosome-1 [Coccinella septempunctata]
MQKSKCEKMSQSEMNFKAYFVDEENSEVKRFSLPRSNGKIPSFVTMEEKLKLVFPSLRYCDFKINWKDGDGDLISISNDEDFMTALTEMNCDPKVLYVNTKPKKSPEATLFRVICDVCENGISGYRYKCIECPDYDLCSACESSGNHSEHMVLRLPNSNTSIAKLDRKMMYNAARALKKSVVQAHRCAYKESFKNGEKDKPSRSGDASSSTKASQSGCPFGAADMNALLGQNISPILEMLSKSAPTSSDENQGASNPLADLIHSVVEAFTGSVITEPTDTVNKTASQEQTNSPDKKQDKIAQTTTQPSAPTANANSQEMEWTIVGGGNEDSTSQASASSKTSTVQQPPQPSQDPRLMRGLAQLHEMGFSNENNFLNYLLEMHDYDVARAVKAILQLK